MAGTITVSTISDGSVSTSSTNCIQGSAKAWVNFNGTLSTPITPRGSYNVGSVTKNGTGDYTVNFTNAMPNVNYCWLGIAKGIDGAVNYNYPSVGNRFTTLPATTSIRVGTAYQGGASPTDFDYVYVAVFSS
jgi:hypothetical protein